MKKCTVVVGGYLDQSCMALANAIQFHPTKRSKGLFSRSVVNIDTSESLGSQVSLHSGDFVGNGVVLNYCPFCGNPARDFTEKEKEYLK